MEREIGENTNERMDDRPRVPGRLDDSQETIPTDDVSDADIGDAMPSVDDV